MMMREFLVAGVISLVAATDASTTWFPTTSVEPWAAKEDGQCCSHAGCGDDCASFTWHKTFHCGVGNWSCAPCIDLATDLVTWVENGQNCTSEGLLRSLCHGFSKPARQELCESLLKAGCRVMAEVFLAGGRDPAKMCSGFGACGSTGMMCGCYEDGACIDPRNDASDCCTGKLHISASCGGQQRCGCRQDGQCLDIRDTAAGCCSGSMSEVPLYQCASTKMCGTTSVSLAV